MPERDKDGALGCVPCFQTRRGHGKHGYWRHLRSREERRGEEMKKVARVMSCLIGHKAGETHAEIVGFGAKLTDMKADRAIQ